MSREPSDPLAPIERGHPFDHAIRLQREPGEPDVCSGHTDPAWANMVGPFGGITAAVLLNAALTHPARLGDPVALTVNFAGPVADGSFRIDAKPVRTNRSTQHWSIVQSQGDEVATTASAVFALRRDTWQATDATRPAVPGWDELTPAPGRPGMPVWFKHYALRFVRGMPGTLPDPAAPGPGSLSILWIRDEPPRALDFASLAAICDNFAPRIMVRRPPPVPSGTVSLTTYFHATAAQIAAHGERPVLGVARAARFGAGWHDQSAELWGDDGQGGNVLLASSHQVVYFKG